MRNSSYRPACKPPTVSKECGRTVATCPIPHGTALHVVPGDSINNLDSQGDRFSTSHRLPMTTRSTGPHQCAENSKQQSRLHRPLHTSSPIVAGGEMQAQSSKAPGCQVGRLAGGDPVRVFGSTRITVSP